MADYVTVAEVRTAIGIQDLYSDADIEQVCEAATSIIDKKLWHNSYPVAGVSILGNVATVILATVPALSTGQTITITNSGTAYDGTHTIIGTYPWTTGTATFNWWAVYPFVRSAFPNGYSMIQFNVTHADDNYHNIVPYGKCTVSTVTGVDYADEAPVRLAALELAIDMWQAKQQSNAGGISPDFSPSPYRMGRSLLNRVNGLLADYLSPKGMLG